jgi:anti-sigma B factor antagonist
MSHLARLSVETAQDVQLAQIVGEIDASNVGELREELLAGVPNSSRALVLDLSGTTYIDSSGISMIFEMAASLNNRRQELRLVVVPRSFVAEVLAAVSIDQALTIDPAMADALEAFGVTSR